MTKQKRVPVGPPLIGRVFLVHHKTMRKEEVAVFGSNAQFTGHERAVNYVQREVDNLRSGDFFMMEMS